MTEKPTNEERIKRLEIENTDLKAKVDTLGRVINRLSSDMGAAVKDIEARLKKLEEA